MFAISIDADWAIQPLINDVSDILNEFKTSATFFLTNTIDYSNLKNHELAIHPNYEKTTEFEEVLKKTLQILPDKKSRGVRSHKLYYNTTLPSIYEKLGIEYDSNYILPNYENPIPFFIPNSKVLEIPFFFGDDQLFSSKTNFDLENLSLTDSGVKVFMFHPYHVFMNSSSSEDYLKNKPHYNDYEYLDKNKNYKKRGIRGLFIKLLEFIESNHIETNTMAEINEIWRKNLTP